MISVSKAMYGSKNNNFVFQAKKLFFKMTMSNKRHKNTLDVTELGILNLEKQTRFQVNPVKSEDENKSNVRIHITVDAEVQTDDDEDNDLPSVTDRTRLNSEYAKSFR